jgi:hypothetical protein
MSVVKTQLIIPTRRNISHNIEPDVILKYVVLS